MVANLNDLTMVYDYDLVGILHRTQSMSYNHDSLSLVKLIQVLHDASLIVGIQRVGRLVKEDVVGILIHRNGTLAYTQISHKTYYKPEDVMAIVAVVEDRKKDMRFHKRTG